MARPHLHAANTKTESAAHESTELAASARVDAAASGDVGDVDWKTIARRERKRQQRQELLRAMTLDERKRFIHEEGEEKSHQTERMQRAMDAEGGRVKLAIDLRYDSIMNDKVRDCGDLVFFPLVSPAEIVSRSSIVYASSSSLSTGRSR
jgi:hypothetical protein